MAKLENENYLHGELTGCIIKAALFVLKELGHGFAEKVYENSLFWCLQKMGFKVEQQQKIDVCFRGVYVGEYHADLVVNDLVIIELKAVECIHPRHEVQLVNYLKATRIEVGLLLNFAETLEITRKVFANDRKNLPE